MTQRVRPESSAETLRTLCIKRGRFRKSRQKAYSSARERLIEVGYDPAYGARPLKRAIQKELETPLARKLVAGEIRDGQKVRIDVRSGAMVFEVESPARAAAS